MPGYFALIFEQSFAAAESVFYASLSSNFRIEPPGKYVFIIFILFAPYTRGRKSINNHILNVKFVNYIVPTLDIIYEVDISFIK